MSDRKRLPMTTAATATALLCCAVLDLCTWDVKEAIRKHYNFH